MRILVVGGAGYIGSHMVKLLVNNNSKVAVFDNLSTGFRDAVVGGEFIHGDLADLAALETVFENFKPTVVMHFASSIQVGESVKNPQKYYQNNVCNTLNLLNTMVKFNVFQFVFSSTAAIFGEPKYVPIDESHPKAPLNPYGKSKLFIEEILADYDKAYGLKSICLRYFNAAGADSEGELGERHDPETHLIPLILQAISGRKDKITVFGQDYDTEDGTCIRDYIHVEDLCSAHYLAIEKLANNGESAQFNLGNGSGFSVQSVIHAAEKVTGLKASIEYGPRRDGDPARLVADSKAARDILNWKPKYHDLELIIKHAWNWEQKVVGNLGLKVASIKSN